MQDLLRQIKDLQPGDHLCLIYETDAEHRAFMTPFLRQGLESGEKVIYIVDARPGELVLGYLRDDGVDADAYVQQGQLVILEARDVYMREEVFNPDGMIQFLRSEIEKALAEGYGVLRVSGEMSWVLRRSADSERLIEYEAKLNDFLKNSRCLAICQYDRRRFSAELLLAVMTTHFLAVIGTEIYDNAYYIPPDDLLGANLEAATLSNWINDLSTRKTNAEALQNRASKLEKRLNCFYGIAALAEDPGMSLSVLLQRVIELIPIAWQYPEIACAALFLEEDQFQTKNFRETPWKLSSVINVEGKEVGRLQVHYLEEKPQADEGPFQRGERQLIDAIAERIGRIIERKRAQEGLSIRNRIANIFLTVPDDDMYGEVLKVVLEVMNSTHGIFGYTDEDGSLVCPSFSRDVYAQCQVPDKSIRFPRETWGNSIWGRAVREKCSLYANEPGRVPEGHVPIQRALAVPILFHEETIGHLVVANKPTDYDVRDLKQLEGIAFYIAPVLQARLQRDREDKARRQAEERLQALSAYSSSLIENSLDSLVTITPDGKIVDANKAAEEATGIRREHLIGGEFPDFFSEPDKATAGYKRVLAEGYIRNYPLTLRHISGRTMDVLCNASIYRSETGEVRGIFAAVRDITEYKQMEQALALREQEYHTLLENIPDLITRYDTDLRRIFVNRAWEKASGLSAVEVINKRPEEISKVPIPAVAGYTEKLQEVISTGIPQTMEFPWENARGETLFLEYVMVPEYDRHGKVVRVLSVGRDQTERKRAEEERLAHLRFFENLDQINRTLKGTSDLEQMMSDVLDAVLAIFACDRAWLFYPCDPEAATWRVPMERTRPEHPGAFALGGDYPMTPETADVCRALKAASGAVRFGPGAELPLDPNLSQRFSYQSQICMAIYPKGDKPYIFGLHQCSYPRVWTPAEEQLFQEIGRRLTDALTSLLMYRNLRESETNYRLLFETMQQGVVYLDTEGQVISMNPAAERILGTEAAKLLGQASQFISHQTVRSDGSPFPVTEYPSAVAMRTGKEVRDVVMGVYNLREEGFRWININAVPLIGEPGGRPYRVYVVFEDITERKRAEEEIKTAAKKWHTTFDAIGDAVLLLDRDSKIVQCNQATADLLKKPRAEIIGSACWELIHGTAGPIEGCPVIRMWESRRRETLTLSREGRWLYAVADPIFNEAGEVTSAVHIISDVTEYHQALQKIKNLNILLQAIKKIDEALLRIKNEAELFKFACDQLVGIPYVRFTWIGLVQLDTFALKPVAWAGHEDGYLSSIKVAWDDSPYGEGPGGKSIKTLEPAVTNDIESDFEFLLWRNEALKRGYASVVALPLQYDKQPLGSMAVYSGTKHAFGEEELEFLKQVASDISIGIKSLRLEQEVIQSLIKGQIMMLQTVESIAAMAELRDPYTAGHQRGVTHLACALARDIGLDTASIECIRIAGFLHDIGKIVVPAEILTKPGKLTEYEMNIIKIHPKAGHDILQKIDFPCPVAQIVLQHHERLNGSGYPQGLQATDIIQEAKILAVADVVEAMAAHRPYRPAMGVDQALAEITRNKGTLYDPEVVDVCVKLFTEKGYKFEGGKT